MSYTHASAEVLQEAGAIVPIRTVRDITIVVAPGQPDDPTRAQSFILSWWEKEPPASAGTWGCNVNGWCFFSKRLGTEAREMIRHAAEGDNWTPIHHAMFGPVYAARIWREGDDE